MGVTRKRYDSTPLKKLRNIKDLAQIKEGLLNSRDASGATYWNTTIPLGGSASLQEGDQDAWRDTINNLFAVPIIRVGAKKADDKQAATPTTLQMVYGNDANNMNIRYQKAAQQWTLKTGKTVEELYGPQTTAEDVLRQWFLVVNDNMRTPGDTFDFTFVLDTLVMYLNEDKYMTGTNKYGVKEDPIFPTYHAKNPNEADLPPSQRLAYKFYRAHLRMEASWGPEVPEDYRLSLYSMVQASAGSVQFLVKQIATFRTALNHFEAGISFVEQSNGVQIILCILKSYFQYYSYGDILPSNMTTFVPTVLSLARAATSAVVLPQGTRVTEKYVESVGEDGVFIRDSSGLQFTMCDILVHNNSDELEQIRAIANAAVSKSNGSVRCSYQQLLGDASDMATQMSQFSRSFDSFLDRPESKPFDGSVWESLSPCVSSLLLAAGEANEAMRETEATSKRIAAGFGQNRFNSIDEIMTGINKLFKRLQESVKLKSEELEEEAQKARTKLERAQREEAAKQKKLLADAAAAANASRQLVGKKSGARNTADASSLLEAVGEQFQAEVARGQREREFIDLNQKAIKAGGAYDVSKTRLVQGFLDAWSKAKAAYDSGNAQQWESAARAAKDSWMLAKKPLEFAQSLLDTLASAKSMFAQASSFGSVQRVEEISGLKLEAFRELMNRIDSFHADGSFDKTAVLVSKLNGDAVILLKTSARVADEQEERNVTLGESVARDVILGVLRGLETTITPTPTSAPSSSTGTGGDDNDYDGDGGFSDSSEEDEALIDVKEATLSFFAKLSNQPNETNNALHKSQLKVHKTILAKARSAGTQSSGGLAAQLAAVLGVKQADDDDGPETPATPVPVTPVPLPTGPDGAPLAPPPKVTPGSKPPPPPTPPPFTPGAPRKKPVPATPATPATPGPSRETQPPSTPSRPPADAEDSDTMRVLRERLLNRRQTLTRKKPSGSSSSDEEDSSDSDAGASLSMFARMLRIDPRAIGHPVPTFHTGMEWSGSIGTAFKDAAAVFVDKEFYYDFCGRLHECLVASLLPDRLLDMEAELRSAPQAPHAIDAVILAASKAVNR